MVHKPVDERGCADKTGHIVQVFEPTLNPMQHQIIGLLHIQPTVYSGPTTSRSGADDRHPKSGKREITARRATLLRQSPSRIGPTKREHALDDLRTVPRRPVPPGALRGGPRGAVRIGPARR